MTGQKTESYLHEGNIKIHEGRQLGFKKISEYFISHITNTDSLIVDELTYNIYSHSTRNLH